LEGNLYIKGSGDPKLVTENVWMMLRQLQAKGVRDIRGSLILDRSAFDLGKTTDAVQFDGDPMRAYNAQPDALLINYNA
ncbi:D-alanyl-D-alanine carboxypeptidase, partial [Acinetobacter baumannii]